MDEKIRALAERIQGILLSLDKGLRDDILIAASGQQRHAAEALTRLASRIDEVLPYEHRLEAVITQPVIHNIITSEITDLEEIKQAIIVFIKDQEHAPMLLKRLEHDTDILEQLVKKSRELLAAA